MADPNKREPWPDLSAYALQVRIAKLPQNREVMVLRRDPTATPQPPLKEGENLVDRFERQARQLGFMRNDKSGGVWVRYGTTVAVAAYLREFPKTRVVEQLRSEVTLDATQGAATRNEVKRAEADATLKKSKELGRNRIGMRVWDGPDGRFLRDPASLRLTFESDVKPASPGLFLRAIDDATMSMCADGLIEDVVYGDRIRVDEFLKKAAIYLDDASGKVDPKDDRLPRVRGAIEAAAARFLARKSSGSMRDVFNRACRLHESMPFLSTFRDGDASAPDQLPLPIAVVVQRVLGAENELLGRTLTMPNAGAGQMLSHLPRGMEVKLREVNPILGAQLDISLPSFGVRASRLGTEDGNDLQPTDYENCDLVLGRYPRRLLDQSVTLLDGPPLRRADLAEVATMLSRRTNMGRAILVLDGPSNPDEEAELAHMQAWIGRSFAVEGAVDVAGLLHCGRVEAPPLRILAVGRRRAEQLQAPPESAMRLKEVNDFTALWTWTAEVVANRIKLEAFFSGSANATLTDADPDLEHNAYQAPYVSASKIGSPTTMVPRPLEGASRDALQRVVRRHGNVDDWVRHEFGYDEEGLKASFSPEQVDGLALSLDAQERGRAFLNADQMGLGKGRFNAAHIKRAVMRGKKVIFMTERPTNFSDIWRDIMHIGARDNIKPFILNEGVNVIDERDNTVVLRSAKKSEIDACLRDLAWPANANTAFLTYRQLGNEPVDRTEGDTATWKRRLGDKASWLLKMVDDDTILVLDEIHNGASGNSNISTTLAKAIEGIKPENVIYSSATFAKDARSMSFYTPLLPGGMSSAGLMSILAKGGETMQEVLSTMLVQDGVMIRREHDLSHMEFTAIADSSRFERNRAIMDQFAPILAEMAALSGEIDRSVNKVNQGLEAQLRREHAEDLAAARAQFKRLEIARIGFGSPLYSLTRLFVASLKIEMTVERALLALRNNEKPLILVENTIQSFLEELAESEDDLDGTRFPEFKGLVHRALTRMTTGRQVGVDKQTRLVDLVREPVLKEQVARIRSMIDRLPSLPASAIDVVKERINAAGFVCDEITGRGLEVRDGRVMRRQIVDKTRIKNAFNAGEIDGLVINNAGCTGIDLHAGSRFADKRRRVMIELQSLADVMRQIQAYGRVNRYDQVVGPRIETILSGLPIEVRQNAIRNSQLRKMSANVSSNRESAALIRDIPDLINVVGDRVCTRYADARPELMRRLGFDIDRNQKLEDENAASATEAAKGGLIEGPEKNKNKIRPIDLDSRRSANEFLARLIMAPVALQEQVINELSAEYVATMEELEARGETPLRTKEVQGTVHIRSTSIFEGAETEVPDSIFHAPLHNVEVAIVRKANPMRKEDVVDAIQAGLADASAAHGEALADYILDNRERLLENYLDERFPSVREALAMGNKILVEQDRRMRALEGMLREIRPGCEISFTSLQESDEPTRGIVTSVKHARPGCEHVAAMHAVEFVCPGDIQPRVMKFKTLLDDPAFSVGRGMEGDDYDRIMRRFEDATVSKVEAGRILTGNLFRGMQLAVETGNLGTLVTYETDAGTRHRGILLSRRWRNLNTLPVEIADPELAISLVSNQGAELSSSKELSKGGICLRRVPGGNFMIELPRLTSRRFASLLADPIIAEITRMAPAEDRANGSSIKVEIEMQNAQQAVVALLDKGVRLFCSGKYRKWILDNRKTTEPGEVYLPGHAA